MSAQDRMKKVRERRRKARPPTTGEIANTWDRVLAKNKRKAVDAVDAVAVARAAGVVGGPPPEPLAPKHYEQRGSVTDWSPVGDHTTLVVHGGELRANPITISHDGPGPANQVTAPPVATRIAYYGGTSDQSTSPVDQVAANIAVARAAGETAPPTLRPAYYGGPSDPYEPIKVIEAWDLGFNLGNAIKYIARAGKKDPAKTTEDLVKARQYLDFEIERRARCGG